MKNAYFDQAIFILGSYRWLYGHFLLLFIDLLGKNSKLKNVYPLHSRKAISYLVFHALGLLVFGIYAYVAYTNGYYYGILLNLVIISVIIFSWAISIRKGAPFSARLEVTDQYILCRMEVFEKSIKVFWSEVERIRVTKLKISIYKKNGDLEELSFRDDRGVQKSLLKFIQQISRKENVEVTF